MKRTKKEVRKENTMNNVVLTWLEKNNVNYDFIVINCSNKAKFCQKYGIGLLVDDGIHNCSKASNAGVPSILLDTSGKHENSTAVTQRKNIHHARNWNTVYKIANKLAEKDSQAKTESEYDSAGME